MTRREGRLLSATTTPRRARPGQWYVFIYDENDQAIAHPNQNLLGQDLKGDLGVDVAGYRFGEVMVGAGEQGLWVDFMFLNPASGNQEFKHSWVVRHDGLLFGSGWYQVLPSSPLDVTKADPAEYTVFEMWLGPLCEVDPVSWTELWRS